MSLIEQVDQMIWKKSPNFLESGPNNQNNAKIVTNTLAYFFRDVIDRAGWPDDLEKNHPIFEKWPKQPK